LNPTVPDEAQHNASPLGSVIVTVVLLNVALIWTTARLTLRRVFRFLAFATIPLLLINPIPFDPAARYPLILPRRAGRGPRGRPDRPDATAPAG
jgi:hypothetical protein